MIVVSASIGTSPAAVTSTPGAAAQNNAPPRPVKAAAKARTDALEKARQNGHPELAVS